MAQRNEILYVNFYTDGSAARKMAPTVPAQAPRRQTRHVRQRKTVVYLDPVAVGSLLVAAVLLVTMAVGVSRLHAAKEQKAAMEAYVQQLSEEKAALTETYRSGMDLQEVEKTAQALGMIPQSQAKTLTVQLSQSQQQPQEPTAWEQILAFLSNLFA